MPKRYHNHFQRLTPELFTEIELELSQVIHTRFHLPLDRIFYDTTNFFTYAQVDDDEGLRRLGHSKQKQNGLPLVNYYLLCSKPVWDTFIAPDICRKHSR